MTDYKILKAIRNGTEYELPGGGGVPVYHTDVLIVGGGAGGASMGGGGGGGEVICSCFITTENKIQVTIGNGGQGGSGGCCVFTYGNDGGDSVLISGCYKLSAQGGKRPGSAGTWEYGGVSAGACAGGMSGNGCRGGNGCTYACYMYIGKGGGGGGAGGAGGNFTSYGGAGGAGLYGYGGGGGGGCGGSGGSGGGGAGGPYSAAGCNATACGGGGGGGGSSSIYQCSGGNGAGGIVKICYHSDGTDNINCATGGTVTTSGDYTVHTFTSNGTFCIVS